MRCFWGLVVLFLGFSFFAFAQTPSQEEPNLPGEFLSFNGDNVPGEFVFVFWDLECDPPKRYVYTAKKIFIRSGIHISGAARLFLRTVTAETGEIKIWYKTDHIDEAQGEAIVEMNGEKEEFVCEKPEYSEKWKALGEALNTGNNSGGISCKSKEGKYKGVFKGRIPATWMVQKKLGLKK